jgi:transcriptional regulator with XRE-family HTH domain
MKNKELAQRIKSLRNRQGLSQEELSEKAGLILRTIQRIRINGGHRTAYYSKIRFLRN